jgi:hypothetical protein
MSGAARPIAGSAAALAAWISSPIGVNPVGDDEAQAPPIGSGSENAMRPSWGADAARPTSFGGPG